MTSPKYPTKELCYLFPPSIPTNSEILFAMPNGDSGNAREAAIMKGEGVTVGVADVIFLYSARQL